MKRLFYLACLLPALAITGAAVAADAPAVVPTPKNSGEWQRRHATYVHAAKQGGIDLLFVGDSITEYWDAEGKDVWKKTYEPLKAAQFGIAADKVENILWRLQNGELDPALQPKVLVLLGGVNNSWGCKREQTESRGTSIAAGIAEIVKTVQAKLPKTKILLLAMFPLQDGTSPCVKLANEKIARLQDNKMVFFLDLGPKLADKDGNLSHELTKDGTHLSAKGYQVWADAMTETIQKLMAEKPPEKSPPVPGKAVPSSLLNIPYNPGGDDAPPSKTKAIFHNGLAEDRFALLATPRYILAGTLFLPLRYFPRSYL